MEALKTTEEDLEYERKKYRVLMRQFRETRGALSTISYILKLQMERAPGDLTAQNAVEVTLKRANDALDATGGRKSLPAPYDVLKGVE